jgi:hypothetical protein
MTKIEFKLWKEGKVYIVKDEGEFQKILDLCKKERFKPMCLPIKESVSYFIYPAFTCIRNNIFKFGT